jgi:hypothetical protein
MATQIISRNDTTANWNSNNPILGKGELGIEFLVDGSIKTKIGDGVTHWVSLAYNTIGNKGDKGDKGDTGTGLSRTTSSTINFGTEGQYIESTINDPLIKSSSTILIQIAPGQEEYPLQGVVCGVVSIIDSTSYTIFALAPTRASGVMNINILIF